MVKTLPLDIIADELARLRAAAPLVHILTNEVVQEIIASVLLAAALAFPVVTVVTWLHMRHPPALPKRLVEWMVCLLLVLSGTSLLVSGWNASHPQPVVPDDEMAMAVPQRSQAAAPAPR